MAAILAVAASDNWNSNGSWVGGVQPTAADDVTIVAGANVSIPSGVTALCRSCTVAATGTLTFAATTSVLTIGDATAGASSVAFSNAGTVTLTGVGTINFISTSATVQTVTTGGQTMPNETFNAASNGSWQFSDAHTSSGTITLTKGTLDTNGKTVSCSQFSSSNSNTRVLTLGASATTCSAAAAQGWDTTTTTGLTLNANTSAITCSGASGNFNGGGLTYNNLVMSGGGSKQVQGAAGLTFANLTFTGGAVKTDSFAITNAITVNTALTMTGNSVTNRILVSSGTVGTSRTITLGGSATAKTNCSNVDFMDITMSGGAANELDFSAITGNSGDCGGNSGITFTNAAAQTWSGTSGGNWSANAWTSRVPLPQDDVTVNAAFSASQTVTADMPRMGKSVNFTGATGTPTLATNSTLYGSLTLISGMTLNSFGPTFAGRGAFTFTSAGRSLGTPTIQAPGGTVTLQDNLTSVNRIFLNNGTFDANGNTVTVLGFTSNSGLTRTLAMGSGQWTLTDTATVSVWTVTNAASGLTITGTPVIVISNASANTRQFDAAGFTYGTLTYTVAGSTGKLVITGDKNVFNTINFSDASNARTLQFVAARTNTISIFNVFGTSGKLMTVNTATGGTATTLLSPSAWLVGANSTLVSGDTGLTVAANPYGNMDYLSIQDITAQPTPSAVQVVIKPFQAVKRAAVY